MALCPFADKRWLIRPGSNDPRISPRIAILHSDGGNVYNLGDYFDGPSGGIESHFHIPKDGKLFQYRDTDWEADANYLANPFAISIETQGTGWEEWTEPQIAMILRLLAWLHQVHPAIALQRVDRWNGTGVGYHIQFGSPGKWTNVGKICPGPKRIQQYNNRIIPALASGGVGDWFDMADQNDLRKIVREEIRDNLGFAKIVVDMKGKGPKDDRRETLNWVLRALLNDEAHLRNAIQANADTVIERVMAEMPAETTGSGLSAAEVREAVERGVRNVFSDLGEEDPA